MGDILRDCEGVLKMTNRRIELGDMIKDTVTGYQGMAVKRTECLGYNQAQITIQAVTLDDNGYPMDEVTLSEDRLIKI